jgi:hypothetical protein
MKTWYLSCSKSQHLQIMKYLFVLIIIVFLSGCQVTETIHINADGSGNIEVVELRDENSYMQVAGENYSKEEVFKDTTYVFKDYITKYNETFLKYTLDERRLFQKYANVKAHIKKSSFEKEFRTIITQDFNSVSEVADLYKAEAYADDLKNNYALTAENHYYKIEYHFDGKVFKRLVSITNQTELQKTKEQFTKLRTRYKAQKLAQSYVLRYYFPRKIISVSNDKAVISLDKKSLAVEFQLSDCLKQPEMTSLEVVLE